MRYDAGTENSCWCECPADWQGDWQCDKPTREYQANTNTSSKCKYMRQPLAAARSHDCVQQCALAGDHMMFSRVSMLPLCSVL